MTPTTKTTTDSPRPIRSEQDYEAALADVERLLSKDVLSADERDRMEVLATLIQDWEDTNVEIQDVSAIDMIRHLMEERGWRQRDLASVFGSESIVSEVLNGRRQLQRKHIEELARIFDVAPSVFFPALGAEPTSLTAELRQQDAKSTSLIEGIEGLNPESAARFVCELAAAEVSLLGLPIHSFSYARNADERDGGVDLHLDLPVGAPTPFPTGKTKWQVKSGSRKPSAKTDLSAKKRYLRAELKGGAEFVLAWTQARPEVARSGLVKTYKAAVDSIRSGTKVWVLTAEQLAELARRHPRTIVDFNLSPFWNLLSLEQWEASLQGKEIPFLLDDARSRIIDAARRWIHSSNQTPIHHWFGTAGVGKTRTALEVFKRSDLGTRVLYAPSPLQVPGDFWQWLINHTESRLILVVDECSPEDNENLSVMARVCSGRVKVLTLGDRELERDAQSGADSTEVPHLEATQTDEELARQVGITPEQARFVLHFTKGYPLLTWRVAKALAKDPSHSGDDLLAGLDVKRVLKKMLPDPTLRRHLGLLSLFTYLGFDGAAEAEAKLACEAFDVDFDAFRKVISAERDLVGRVHRYRHVTPLLFAVWVGTEFLKTYRSDLRERLQRLPKELYDRFERQLQNFAPESAAQDIANQLLGDSPGPFPPAEIGRAGRLLLALAPLARERVAQMILASVKQDPAATANMPNRMDVIWTLEYCAWYPDTFPAALEALLLLYIVEGGAKRIDSAAQALFTLFNLQLGGTSVSYRDRLAALLHLVGDDSDDQTRVIAVAGLMHGLGMWESRTEPALAHVVVLPKEWRPKAIEEWAAREEIWRELLRQIRLLRDKNMRNEQADKVADAVSHALLTIPAAIVASELPIELMSARGKAKAAQGVRWVLTNRPVSTDARRELDQLIKTLRGQSLRERLEFCFAASPWELAEGDKDEMDRPPVISDLAREVAATPGALADVVDLALAGAPQTVGQFFECLVRLNPGQSEELFSLADARGADSWAALAGILHATDPVDPEWVDAKLLELSRKPEMAMVTQVAFAIVTASDRRASMITDALRAGSLSSKDTYRLQFGGWALTISPRIVEELIEAIIADGDPLAAEIAVGLLDHYLDTHPESAPVLSQQVADLIVRLPLDAQMASFHRQRLLTHVEVPVSALLQALSNFIEQESPYGWTEPDIELLDQLFQRDTRATVGLLNRLILRQRSEHGWSKASMSLEPIHYLTRAQRVGSADTVRSEVVGLSPDDQAQLAEQFDYEAEVPDPLLVELIQGNEGFASRAASEFFHRPHGWTGSRADVLRRRVEDARRWAKAPNDTLNRWALTLASALEAAIPPEEQFEAEADAVLWGIR